MSLRPTGNEGGGRQAGFQGSETSSAELTLYTSAARDPVLPLAGDKIEFTGRSKDDANPSLIAVTTAKQMGAPSGQWSATVKAGHLPGRDIDIRDLVADDQWVDIVFKRFNRPFATMRGSVDFIQRSGVVGGKGATSETYTLGGRDFGKVWEATPIWFNRFTAENVFGAAGQRVTDSVHIGGSVDNTVRAFLVGFLEELGGRGRANWLLPTDMPGVASSSGFITNVAYDHSGFTNNPSRKSVSPNFMDPDGGGAWALAQEWSDPTFCELWTDTLPVKDRESPFGDTVGRPPQADFSRALEDQITVDDVRMCVILRDRPFPTVELGRDSPWFSLPLAVVDREEIAADSLTRGGSERYNAFFVSPQVLQGFLMPGNLEVTAPLWDTDDMLIHGLRRFDVNTRYVADLDPGADSPGALLTITEGMRERVRDWYAINPYLYSGDIVLGRGRPDIRVGMRVRVPGFSAERDETYYVEAVQQSWQFGQSLKTTLGVTRGWIGTDDGYLSAVNKLASRYAVGKSGVGI